MLDAFTHFDAVEQPCCACWAPADCTQVVAVATGQAPMASILAQCLAPDGAVLVSGSGVRVRTALITEAACFIFGLV